MLTTNLKAMREVWTKNPRITRTELMVEFRTSSQNITRWMHSAGLGQIKDLDKEFRYLLLPDLIIQEITDSPPDGLSERQKTEYYIKAGYNSHSIALHQNILWATIDEMRYNLENLDTQLLNDQSVEAQSVKQLPINEPVKIDPKELQSSIYEDGQHKNNFPEFGDKPPHHISEIVQALFFPNGIPTCQSCKRDVTYTDIIFRSNDFPEFPKSHIPVDARPKIIMPIGVAYAHMNNWAEFMDFPLSGYKDIDEIRIAEAFVADTMAFVIRKRMGWIAQELLKKRRTNANWDGGENGSI